MSDLSGDFIPPSGDDFMAQLAKEIGYNEGDLNLTPGRDDESVQGTPVPGGIGVAETPAAGTGSESGATPPPIQSTQLTPEQELAALREEMASLRKEAENAQILLGRQATELGELRKSREAPAETEEQTFAPAPITDEVEEQIADAIARNGGINIAQWAAVNAPHLYETVLDLWAESDERGAARKAAAFDLRLQTALREQGEAQEYAANEQFIAEVAPTLDKRVSELASEYGLEAGAEATDALLAETLDNASPALKALVVSKDAEQREAGLHAILALAAVKGRATPPDPAAAAAAAEALAKAKGEASLGTGGLHLQQSQEAQEPQTEEEKLASAIVAGLTASKPTSVAAGLSGGWAAPPAGGVA